MTFNQAKDNVDYNKFPQIWNILKYLKSWQMGTHHHRCNALEHDIEIMYKPAYIIVTSLISSHFVVTVTVKRLFSSVIKKQHAHTG